MSENLFLGDSTYPNTSKVFQLRQLASEIITIEADLIDWAADRIEQLERLITQEQNRAGRIGTHSDDCHTWGHQHYECLLRKFEESQKGHARYEYVRKLNAHQFQKIFTMNLTSAIRFDDFIDAAIKGSK